MTSTLLCVNSRWQDYLFNIWSFTRMKIRQSCHEHLPNLQKWQTFKISPNVVGGVMVSTFTSSRFQILFNYLSLYNFVGKVNVLGTQLICGCGSRDDPFNISNFTLSHDCFQPIIISYFHICLITRLLSTNNLISFSSCHMIVFNQSSYLIFMFSGSHDCFQPIIVSYFQFHLVT